jgi:hypothetical protein
VGLAKDGYETITGQFAIGAKLCAEPRVDPLLTVTYAYLEKGVVTQAISGPFDLGRPSGCRPNANSGFTRLDPRPVEPGAGKRKHPAGKRKHPTGQGKRSRKGEHGKPTGKNGKAAKPDAKRGTGKETGRRP